MWEIELDFAVNEEDDPEYWEGVDSVTKTFTFSDEAKARAFFEEAYRIVEAGWGDDDEPTKAMLEFVRKYDVVVYDLDGVPCGGFYEGKPAGWFRLALQGVLRVVEFHDLRDEWRGDVADVSRQTLC